MGNAGLDEAQAGINIAKRSINMQMNMQKYQYVRYADDTTFMAESKKN